MASKSESLDGGTQGESLTSARHKGHRVSTKSLGSTAENPPRRNALLQRRGEKDRHAKSHKSRSPSLRHEPLSSSDPLPPRSPRRRQPGRLSLGHRTQRAVTGDGTATVETGFARVCPVSGGGTIQRCIRFWVAQRLQSVGENSFSGNLNGKRRPRIQPRRAPEP